jgi:hypothetical protein
MTPLKWRNPIKATRRVVDHAKQLGRLELELKKVVLKRKGTDLGIGAGLGAAVVLLTPVVVVFFGATLAAALATTISLWLSLLIVALLLLAIVAGLGAGAYIYAKKATEGGLDDGS